MVILSRPSLAPQTKNQLRVSQNLPHHFCGRLITSTACALWLMTNNTNIWLAKSASIVSSDIYREPISNEKVLMHLGRGRPGHKINSWKEIPINQIN